MVNFLGIFLVLEAYHIQNCFNPINKGLRAKNSTAAAGSSSVYGVFVNPDGVSNFPTAVFSEQISKSPGRFNKNSDGTSKIFTCEITGKEIKFSSKGHTFDIII